MFHFTCLVLSLELLHICLSHELHHEHTSPSPHLQALLPEPQNKSLSTNVYVRNNSVGSVQNDAKIANEFFNLMGQYDRNIRPNYTGDPTVVKVDFDVMNIGAINEVGMISNVQIAVGFQTFTVDLFFRQIWNDYRMRHNLSQPIIPLLGRRSPPDLIWTPDTVFANAKNAKKHHVTVNNDKLDVKSNGTVFWGSRTTVEARCVMDFHKYPMDTQICNLTLQSYAYTTLHIKYKWGKKKAVNVLSPKMSQYILTDVTTDSTDSEFADIGTYSTLTATFIFERQISVSIMQLFFPATAIVSVSWLSMWVHKNCVSARIGLGVTTLLTICAFWGSINRQLPRVNYVKAVDIYFIVSFCFILLSLLEYTIVLNLKFNLWKKKKTKLKSSKNQQQKEENLKRSVSDTSHLVRRKISQLDNSIVEGKLVCEIDNTGRTIQYSLAKKEDKKKKLNYKIMPYFFKSYPVSGKPDTLDVIGRFMFPFMYLCFNVYFWKTYSQTPVDAHR